MIRKKLSAVALLGAATLLLSACSGTDGGAASDSPASGTTELTVRVWDEAVAASYKESFAAFEKQNSDITVSVNTVPWSEYWSALRKDVAAKSADDLFWVNASSYPAYVDSGNLVDIGATLGDTAKNAWEPSVVEQYTRSGKLWGVPQLYDAGIAVYYNADLLSAAGVEPKTLNDLTWNPDAEKDTYLKTAKALTRDAAGVAVDAEGFDGTPVTYGTSLNNDGQAVILPFIGSNGGVFQDGDNFAFANTESAEAIKYVVDAINTSKVAPPAAETNENSDVVRDQFVEGKLATFQSGIYNLKTVSEKAGFSWGVAMLPEGPEGRVSVTNGIAVAGNAAAAKEKQPAIKKLLAWMGSTEGADFIGRQGTHVPAVTDAQKTFFDYWKGKKTNVDPFFDVVKDGKTIPPFHGGKFVAGQEAYAPIFKEIFAGTLDVRDGLKKAQAAGNVAMNG
ncbi:sugar ABC transporter substrate-binding protein [Mycetocola tolaasinivorans]|uniref:Sugar ABC transporter substrate-binding protein n=1 Tax=Mycetocola tolaasinivorans TaxID=76635 RepID=A0A3L7A5D0_9MICO|nr:sugar ABC transporter substrate-binding protein [Mycetocola tolaasinivorans]RLP75255.1 sugar ABC transporter substrate-binding protein [Mycetocola tolaasinivorans]